MKSAIVDGNDVLAVERTTREAVAYARAGNGPVLIEAKTMRMLGHAQHDSAEYVPKEMRESWKQRDPLDLFEKVLTEKKLWDAKTKKEIDERIAREIRADVEFAENSPVPPPESAEEGVYCEGCHTIQAGMEAAQGRSDAAALQCEGRMADHILCVKRRAAFRLHQGSGAESKARKEICARGRSRKGGALRMPETTYLEAIRQAMQRRDGARPLRGPAWRGYRRIWRRVQGFRRAC